MIPQPLLESPALRPLAWVGRASLEGVGYLGGLASLATASARSTLWPAGDPAPAPFWPTVFRQTVPILAMGAPLVALVHVGIGSFLSMQAYFGGTFVDGTGAVVGVGLIRNIATMMTGFTLAGLLAVMFTPELRGRSNRVLDADPRELVDRDVARGLRSAERPEPEPARLAAVRIGASLIAGPVLSLWAVLVGTLVGWQVAHTLLGVSTHSFFTMFVEMLWLRDVSGLAIKGGAFALFASLFACHEGLRGPQGGGTAPELVAAATCRAACFSTLAMLVLNSGWFLLAYHAGPAFGPTLLAPPAL